MTELETQIWAATYAAVYIDAMDIGRRQGKEPTPDVCNGFARAAIDIADSAVYAIRHTYDESELVHAGLVNAHKGPDDQV